MAINGTNIILYYYNPTTQVGIPFGSATNCTFNVNVEQVEVTSQCSSWFRQFKNDIATWTVDCDGFMALSNYSYLFLANLQLSRESIQIKFQIDNGVEGYTVFSGNANLMSLSLSGPVENTSTYSVSLQGSGPYTISGTQVAPTGVIVQGTNVRMYDFTAAGGEVSVSWGGAIGSSCVAVTRGGIEVRNIITTGTPTGEDVKFNSSTGTLTFASARPLESDEFVRILVK